MAEKSFGLKQINMIGVGTPAIESSDDLIIKTNSSERVRIESGGNIGIGTDIARTELDVRGDIWINRSSANGQPAHFSNPTQLIVQHTSAPNVYLIRGEYRTSIDSGDYLGQINFASNNNSSGQGTPVVAASIACDAQQSWTSSFNPGELIFRTNPGNSTSPTDAVGITSEGNIKLYRSGAGIDFSATADSSGTVSSEILDDYEEGEWTPTFLDGGGGTATEDVQDGMYVKIGKMVHVSFVIGTSANTIPGTNNIRIEGLPFDIDYSYISNTTSYRGEFEAIFFTVNASTQYTLSTENTNTLTIRETSNGGGNVASTWSDVTDAASFEIRGSIWYPAT